MHFKKDFIYLFFATLIRLHLIILLEEILQKCSKGGRILMLNVLNWEYR